MSKLGRIVESINGAETGSVRVTGKLGGPHPADGLTAQVALGGGAVSTIINPQSFADGGPEWRCRYGNVESIRYTAASLLASYDYLLSDNISMQEATRRLRLMRAARSALGEQPEVKE
jgi:hypothetical protein